MERPPPSDRCRKTGATLLIARVDRLARNVRFISALTQLTKRCTRRQSMVLLEMGESRSLILSRSGGAGAKKPPVNA
jgi:hypothetical protein